MRCYRCGLRIRCASSEPPNFNHIELEGDPGELCQAVPHAAEPDLCPELRSAIDRIQRFHEIGYLG